MYRKILLLVFQLSTASLFSQYAIFTIDRDQGYLHHDDVDRFANMSWIINGKPFASGMPDVKIIPDPSKIDTILFRNSPDEEWLTILCNIRHPYTYTFSYNECCGGFYLNNYAAKESIWTAEIQIKVADSEKETYRASLWGSPIQITAEQTNTLLHEYGAMDSRIVEFSLEKLTWKGSESYHTPDQYTKICEFLYLPIDPEEPFSIIYDPETDKLTLQ